MMPRPPVAAGTCVAAATTLLFFLAADPAVAFQTNGKKWPAMPVQYWINPAACPVMSGGETIVDLVEAATAGWADTACSDASFQYMGTTDAMWAPDGMNTIFCVDGENMEWSFGEDAGGATLWLPTEEGEPMEVDLALNAYDLKWIEGGGDAMTEGNIDPTALIAHELGHWLGLSHSPDPYATMYYASLPFGLQATPDADDKAAICTLYPSGAAECSANEDCPDDHECVTIQEIPVCTELHDGPGAKCSKNAIDCDGMCWVSFYECTQLCLFTTLDYSDGYCAPLCEDSPTCPEGFGCVHVVQDEGAVDVHICMLGAETPEASPEVAEGPADETGAEVVDWTDVLVGDSLLDGLADVSLHGETVAEHLPSDAASDIAAQPDQAGVETPPDAGNADAGDGNGAGGSGKSCASAPGGSGPGSNSGAILLLLAMLAAMPRGNGRAPR